MGEKIASFLFTLALMGWDIYNIARGHATVFTWIMLVVLALGGIFEFGAICEAAAKKSEKDPTDSSSDNDQAKHAAV